MILDSKQKSVKKRLKELAKEIADKEPLGFLQKIFGAKSHQIKSLYIYGDVGRGKSMLMKKFYNSLKDHPKIQIHFNSFMQSIHEALRDIRNEDKKYKDELIEATKRVIKDKKLICFDEFQVVDIADAMLLSRIFSYLFSQNIVAVFTSNSHPMDLYKNGLQREIFLEFVNRVLLVNAEILHLDSKTDYRSIYRQNLDKRYFLESENGEAEIKKIIKNLTEGKEAKEREIEVWGRKIIIKKTFGDVAPERIAITNFNEICKENYAAADYRAICKSFDLIFLKKLPKLTEEDVNEARRFILFIDEVYENKVALIINSQVNPEEIYKSGTGSEAFFRTVSRLNEIKSDQYWQESKLNF